MSAGTVALVMLVGGTVGFLGGLFGKGGSAIATPLLAALGLPPIVALASPLPATVPSTIVASYAYWREGRVDRRLVLWSAAFGVPAVAAGACSTRWIGGEALVRATELLIAALGARSLLGPRSPRERTVDVRGRGLRIAVIAIGAGFASGLLANAGGFLLAPLYLGILRLPIKDAFAGSLAVASVLAIPGTIVHAVLGHVDWSVVVALGTASVPLSYVGARLALRTPSVHLERVYGAALLTFGAVLFAVSL